MLSDVGGSNPPPSKIFDFQIGHLEMGVFEGHFWGFGADLRKGSVEYPPHCMSFFKIGEVKRQEWQWFPRTKGVV